MSRKTTPTPQQKLQSKRQQILALAARHGARNLRVFGSVAHGTATTASDIDFLIAPNPAWSLLDHIRFKQALEMLLDCPVDVIIDDTLHPRIKEQVLRDAQPL